MDESVLGYFDGGGEAGNLCHTGSLFPFALANLLTPSTALPPTMFLGAEEISVRSQISRGSKYPLDPEPF